MTNGPLPARFFAMKSPIPVIHGVASWSLFLIVWLIAGPARADWQRNDSIIAWLQGTNLMWRFSFHSKHGKPFFEFFATGGVPLAQLTPGDHPWHYGLWFSWKFINRVNYWEESRETGKAGGSTRWSAPTIETQLDGSALIRLAVTYTHPTGRVDMTETRLVGISAPTAGGDYTISWNAVFKAGNAGAVLDRTPMPGEPDGKVNGGYAGLALRRSAPPLGLSVLCSTGIVSQFESNRARPAAAALACNFNDGARDLGGIAIFSDPINSGENAPWYVVNSTEMRLACAAILAPNVRTLRPGEEIRLRYRIAVRSRGWTTGTLQSVMP